MEVKPGYKQTEIGPMPEDWEVRTVGEIARFSSGRGISVSRLHDYSTDYPVPVFGGNGIAGYTATAIALKRTLVIGRVGQRCGEVYLTDGPAWVSDNALYPRQMRRECDLRFFSLALHASGLNNVKNRNDLPLITQSILHAVKMAWPAEPVEQSAIAATLGEVDALVGALDRLIAKKRDLKQAAMQQLLTGHTRLPGFREEWKVKQLGEIAQPRTERVDPRRSSQPRFCVELEHVEQGTGRLCGSTATTASSSLKSVFGPRDVLFGKLRAYLRKFWMADRNGVCSTEIWVLAPRSLLLTPEYLFQIVSEDRFIEAASSAYGTHMPRSDWNVVKNYNVGLPAPEEQSAIAGVLFDMDAEVAALEKRRDKTCALKQAMMEELLTGRTRLVKPEPVHA